MPHYIVRTPVYLAGEVIRPGEVVRYAGEPPSGLEPITPQAHVNAEIAALRRRLSAGLAQVGFDLLRRSG